MPVPALLAAGITAGANLLGSAFNAGSTARQNRLNRNFSREMYNTQRKDALSDWAMQNSYNHPSAVMQRLREANLNPHLVYGEGANMPAAQIRPASASNPNTEAPQVDLGGAASKGLAAYLQVEMQQQTVDNLRKQNDLLVKEALLKEAQIHSVNADTISKEYDISRKNFDLDYSMDTRTSNMEKLEAEVDSIRTNTDLGLQKNEREAALAASSISEAVARVLSMRYQNAKSEAERRKINAEIQNIKKDGELKQLDIDLKKNGIQPSDPAWMRILIRALNKFKLNDARTPGEQLYDQWEESNEKTYY